MSRSSKSEVRVSWADRLRQLVQGESGPESGKMPEVFHRRTALATMIGGPAVALLAVGGKAEAAPPRGANADDFRSIRGHENEHVTFLETALGAAKRPIPNFKNLEQKRFIDFARVSQALENTGCGAYLGAAPKIFNRGILAAAGSIALIEARHAGFLNVYLGDPITGNSADPTTDNAFEDALTDDEVVMAAGGFIQDLNGGDPIAYDDTPSDANDVKILNFALALEYLEAAFYNINVPKFFRGRNN